MRATDHETDETPQRASLEKNGKTMNACDHGVMFNETEARKLIEGWAAADEVEFIMGCPASAEVRKRWPRLNGSCPKGCGYVGIAYASHEHYTYGDW